MWIDCTNEFEIQCVTSICYFSFLFLIAWRSRFTIPVSHLSRFIFEFLIFMIPQLGAVLYPSCMYIISMILFIGAALTLVLFSPVKSSIRLDCTKDNEKLFLENLRAFIMIQTCISILAVDFSSIYPGRFAKTDTIGISLMDIGVGFYVTSSALGLLAFRGSTSFLTFFKKLFYKCVILFFIGIIRLYSIILTNYSYSVSEYGVHWNFFMSLAFVFFISLAIGYCLPNPLHRLLLSIISISIYQYFLSFYGLEEYLFSSERGPSLISLNKEGVFSVIGYVFIYLALQGICEWKFQDLFSRTRVYQLDNRWSKLFELTLISISTWIIYFITKGPYINILPSRREANLTYGLWIISSILTHVCINLLLDLSIGSSEKHRTLLFRSINRNPLTIFLFANILTGLLNIFSPIPLGNISPLSSTIIILIYTFIVCFAAFILDVYMNVKIK